jgi:hypothetical protein
MRSSLRAQGGSGVPPGKAVGVEADKRGLSTAAGGDEVAWQGSSMVVAIR